MFEEHEDDPSSPSQGRDKLKAKLKGLNELWDLLEEKIRRLRKSLAIETNVLEEVKFEEALKFEIKRQIELEEEIRRLEEKVNEIEHPPDEVPPFVPPYIERVNDSACYQILTWNKLIRIESPGGKWGKTLLLERILNDAQDPTKLNYQTVHISLNIEHKDNLQEPKPFFQWFCKEVSKSLGYIDLAGSDLDSAWKYSNDDVTNCTLYLENHILPRLDKPLVLGLDNAGKLFQILDDSQKSALAFKFFAMLREWYERSKTYASLERLDHWSKLHLVIARSLAVPIDMERDNSPFDNVGECVFLGEFNKLQVYEFSSRYGLNLTGEAVEELMIKVGGQPYLLGVVLSLMYKNRSLAVKELVKTLLNTPGLKICQYLDSIYGKLHYYRSDTKRIFETGLKSPIPVRVDATQQRDLVAQLGLMKIVSKPDSTIDPVIPFCELYRIYFLELLKESD